MATSTASPSEARHIQFNASCCKIPERLLLAHSRGEVLFITGAGTSMSAGLPDFRGLALDVYKRFDSALHVELAKVPAGSCNLWAIPSGTLQPYQLAEARRFVQGDYDVELGMLERRVDGTGGATRQVRDEIVGILTRGAVKPAAIHRSLMRLADRGGTTTIATTNFDLLLEQAARSIRSKSRSYSLGAIPRPGKSVDFAGVLHIHGSLSSKAESAYFVVSDRDFGEFYLRRQVVTDFIYDAARLFNIVLVGYSANDPPMRYLLNAVAADGTRFTDLRERYAFVSGKSAPDMVQMNDWSARGITPIHYDSANNHAQLAESLAAWATYSPHTGYPADVARVVKTILKKPRGFASEFDRDLFDHFYRRGNASERSSLVTLANVHAADPSWMDAFIAIEQEHRHP